MSADVQDEWLRFQMMAVLGNCEVCGALATSVVRDLIAVPEPDAPGQVQKGDLHHFCAQHYRKPMVSQPLSSENENGTA